MLSFLKFIRQTEFIIAANNLIKVQSIGQIKQLLILYYCYFKWFGSKVLKGIEVDLAASFHLNALLLEIKSGVSYDNFINEIKDILGRSNAYRIFDGILEIYIGYKKNPITIEEFKEIQNDLDVNYQANLYNL